MASTLPQNLRDSYRDVPEKVAITLQHAGQAEIPLTYRALLKGANRYALAYEQAGITPGEVVILILPHGQELVFAFWGAILHGCIPSILPFLTEKLSPERYHSDLRALIGITHPAAIVTYPEFETVVRDALTEASSVREVLLSDQIPPASSPDFERLTGLQRDPAEIVLLQHSSGTTGLQKGVALSHQAICNQLQAYSKAIALHDNDVIVSWLPLYHDMGLIAGFMMPVLTRTPLVLLSPFDWVRAPYRLMQAVSAHRGTLTWLPNFACNFLARKTRPRHLQGVDLSSWRAIINCSEPVKAASHRAFVEAFSPYGLPARALQTCYAMAENVFAVTQSDINSSPVIAVIDRKTFIAEQKIQPAIDGQPSLEIMSSGRVLENARLRILDEQGNELPDMVVGEIALQSDCLLNEYYNRPDETEKSFRNGWYLTGDFGCISNGEVFVTGRKKDILIIGGKNVYPQDLEMLVHEVHGVHVGRAVAFGVYDEQAGTDEAVIVAEADDPAAPAAQQLADAIRYHVTQNSAIALRHVQLVPPKWILKTSSGKPARLANREKYLQEFTESC